MMIKIKKNDKHIHLNSSILELSATEAHNFECLTRLPLALKLSDQAPIFTEAGRFSLPHFTTRWSILLQCISHKLQNFCIVKKFIVEFPIACVDIHKGNTQCFSSILATDRWFWHGLDFATVMQHLRI
jgi:hypothetical protein